MKKKETINSKEPKNQNYDAKKMNTSSNLKYKKDFVRVTNKNF